jgi:hypothetical protein
LVPDDGVSLGLLKGTFFAACATISATFGLIVDFNDFVAGLDALSFELVVDLLLPLLPLLLLLLLLLLLPVPAAVPVDELEDLLLPPESVIGNGGTSAATAPPPAAVSAFILAALFFFAITFSFL